MHVCTIIAKNYVPFARVLARSFAEHHPGGRCSVLIIDSIDEHIEPAAEPFEILSPADIDCPAFEAMATIYDVLELSTAVKPWLLRHLLKQSGPEGVVYLDPDIRVFAPLTELETLTRAHGLVVNPHIVSPIPRDGLRPNEQFLMLAGTYNLGFLSIGPGSQSDRLLDWWCERLRHDCLLDPPRGYFVDQRWFDLLPGIVESFHVLREPGYNVAYWNLHSTPVELVEGRYLSGGQPLRFFHFSGFDPDRPDRLSLHQDRIDVRREPALLELCRAYAEELRRFGFDETRRWTYGYASLPDGTRLDPPLRRLFRQVELNGGMPATPFTPVGLQTFFDHLNERASPESPAAITRLMQAVHRERLDVQRAFPDIEGDDCGAFLRWVREHGHDEFLLPDALLPPWGVNVAGCLAPVLGVDDAAQAAITALQAAEVPLLPIPGASMPGSRQSHEPQLDAGSAGFPVNLVCLHPDMLAKFAEDAGGEFFEGRHTIWMWVWEITDFPERWDGAFEHLNELWVVSQHLADALTPVSPIPVIKTGLPVMLPSFQRPSREALGLPDGFVFLEMVDFDSGFERNNPLGTVRAFQRAFPSADQASLVLQCMNSEHHRKRLQMLLAAAAEHPGIHVVTRDALAADQNAIMASCDCFVSLHRAERSGIGPAEAMWLGKPVIATAYGGTLDFMTCANSFLVNNTIAEIGPDKDASACHDVWTKPDEEHAASLMRLVVKKKVEREQRAERAAHDIRITHSPTAIGSVMRRRLEHIHAVSAVGTVDRKPPTDHAWRAIEIMSRGPAQAGASRFGPPGDLLRRLLLRLTRPLAVYQRQVDEAIIDAIIALRESTDRSSADATLSLQEAELLRHLRRQSKSPSSLETIAREPRD